MTTPYTYTTEFRDELEVQRLDLLRRRFLWYCGVIVGLSFLSLTIGVGFAWFGSQFAKDRVLNDPTMIVSWVGSTFSLLVYVLAFSWVYRNPQKKEQVFRIAFWLILITGTLALIQGPIVASLAVPDASGKVRAPGMVIEDINPEDESSDSENESPAATTPTNNPTNAPVISELGITPGTLGLKPPQPADSESPKQLPTPANAASDDDEETDATVTPTTPTSPATPTNPSKKASKATTAVIVTASGLWSVFLTHFFACCFLPWTPRESIRPIIPLLILNAVILLFYIQASFIAIPIAIALSPLVAAPGALICRLRGGKIRDSFTLNVLKGRYSEIKRELVDARRIHESLFPAPVFTGPVRLDYRYEPMRQIGGDYLYARQIDSPVTARDYTHIIIVDVTGHGITAALTVNRLHGEIDRQLGERPESTPAELLTGLNKYLHHTLASHSVYATALCIRVDPAQDELTWASAGHPPAFLRAADGTIDQLDSTTLVLGACKGDDFDPNQQTSKFTRGDALIAYTDGAIESRNAQGRMLGVNGFRAMIAGLKSLPGHPTLDPLIRAVDEHRYGPIQDDTLLVEVTRPVS
jgi:serine phosphatase RsbU (regulator of sigma subunit)